MSQRVLSKIVVYGELSTHEESDSGIVADRDILDTRYIMFSYFLFHETVYTFYSLYKYCNLYIIMYILVIRDSQVLAKLVVVTIFFIGWGQTARLQRVRQNTADRIQTETEQQQTARLQRVRQNTADRILKFDKRYKAFEIAGYFQKHREIIG